MFNPWKISANFSQQLKMFSLLNIPAKNQINFPNYSRDSKTILLETINNRFNFKLIMDQKLSLITLMSIFVLNNIKGLNIYQNNMLKCVFWPNIWSKNISIQKLEKKEAHMVQDQVYANQGMSVCIPTWILKLLRHLKYLTKALRR